MSKRDFFFICHKCYEADMRDEVGLDHSLCSQELWNASEVGGAVFIHPLATFYEDYDPADWREAYEILRPSLEPFERQHIDAHLNFARRQGGRKLLPDNKSKEGKL
jgi:hypothetical protein